MNYNKNNIAVLKIASKSEIRPELACVAFYGDRTVATDSYRAIEVSARGDKKETPTLYPAKLLKAVKLKKDERIFEELLGIVPMPENAYQFPDVDKATEANTALEYTTIKINAEYLEEILNVLKNVNPLKSVTLKLPKDSPSKPLLIEAVGKEQSARALLMPYITK